MRLREIFEDGRIVKGVNTTVDVGTDEIKKQAAKFGNTVDKDGRPPTLSKKVKGSSTNVLFNLGEGKFRSKDVEDYKPDNNALNDLKSKYLPDWEMLDHRTLQAKYVAKDHRHAEQFVKFINRLSEKMDHFAEVTQDVAEVTVKTTTFDVKGLTLLDFQLALIVDQYAEKNDIEQVRMSGNFGMHEDQHVNAKPRGPEFKPTMPKGTVKVDVSDVYDWYKLGMHISDLKGLGKHDFGKGPPSTILSFGDEDLEHEYIKALLKTGLTTTDIDPKSHEKKKGQKTDPTYNVGENFADGKKPGRKGLAKRMGVNCKQPVSKLRTIAKKSSGERAKMAHWCANMKSGKNK